MQISLCTNSLPRKAIILVFGIDILMQYLRPILYGLIVASNLLWNIYLYISLCFYLSLSLSMAEQPLKSLSRFLMKGPLL
jgi:hypothetical protein